MKNLAIAALAVIALGAAIALGQNISSPALTGISAAYNTSPPTCTNGNWCALQTDANGILKTAATISAATLTPTNSSGSFAAATITNSSVQYVAAAAAHTILDIKNESTTATIACAFGATAAINTAGSYTIPPGWHRSWEGSYVPSDAVNCISSAATSPATIEAK